MGVVCMCKLIKAMQGGNYNTYISIRRNYCALMYIIKKG